MESTDLKKIEDKIVELQERKRNFNREIDSEIKKLMKLRAASGHRSAPVVTVPAGRVPRRTDDEERDGEEEVDDLQVGGKEENNDDLQVGGEEEEDDDYDTQEGAQNNTTKRNRRKRHSPPTEEAHYGGGDLARIFDPIPGEPGYVKCVVCAQKLKDKDNNRLRVHCTSKRHEAAEFLTGGKTMMAV